MKIGNGAGCTSSSVRPESPEWCVRVSLSVAENVPAALLRTWIVVEGFCRDKPSCWPGNRAIAARLGVKIRATQDALQALEDHGIAERRPLPGNRRHIFLIRRTADPMPSVEWNSLADRAARRSAGRVALASERKAKRKVHKPSIRIVG
jgi:hypothetical protein